MNRGKRICVVANCLLNVNAKVPFYGFYPGANRAVLDPLLDDGVGLLQLPCPETSYLGLRRWGVTREQLDTQSYREHCERILRAPLLEMLAYRDAGYELLRVLGVNGSPSCGVERTCEGYLGGEIPRDLESLERQAGRVSLVPGKGVFMSVLSDLLSRHGLTVELVGVDEHGDE